MHGRTAEFVNEREYVTSEIVHLVAVARDIAPALAAEIERHATIRLREMCDLRRVHRSAPQQAVQKDDRLGAVSRYVVM